VDMMTVPDMDLNILTTSGQPGAENVIPQTPGFWSPRESDVIPMMQVVLPRVKGLAPEKYDLMTIRVKANNFVNFTATVTNSDNRNVFSVCILY